MTTRQGLVLEASCGRCKPPLRVLFAVPAYAPAYDYGGPIQSLEGLAVGLKRAGVDVRVLTTNASAAGAMDLPTGWTERLSVPVMYLRRWGVHDFTPTFAANVLAAMTHADVVHTGTVFATTSLQALGAAELTACPVVFSPRGAMQSGSLAVGRQRLKRLWLGTFRPLYERVTYFHATSELEADSVRQAVGQGARVEVVPNGTTLPALEAVLAEKALADRPRVVAMGRIHPIKGFDRLIRAAGILRDQGHEFEVEIAGLEEDRAHARQLDALIGELGLADRCRVRPEVRGAEKQSFLARARVFVLASHTENLGNVVIEALAHATAVVASDLTPWGHLAAEGCGVSVPNNPEDLARAIRPFLANRNVAQDAGARGRNLVEREYCWGAVVPKMIALYRQAIAARRPVARR